MEQWVRAARSVWALRWLLWGGVVAGNVALIVLCWLFIWPRFSHNDVNHYYFYAHDFWVGRPHYLPPYHRVPAEYPPLSLAIFSLTMFPRSSNIQLVFGLWMVAFCLLGAVGFARYSARPRWRAALTYLAYVTWGTGLLFLSRYDLIPALATCAALWAAQRRRFTLAYALLAVGVLLKVYPIFLAPLLVVEEFTLSPALPHWGRENKVFVRQEGEKLRWREALPVFLPIARGVGVFAAIIVAGFLAAAWIDPKHAYGSITFAGVRPIEIESFPATIFWLATFFGAHAIPTFNFASHNYEGVFDIALKPFFLELLVVGCLVVYVQRARGKITLAQAFLACVCVVILTGRVFSPQYLLWALPLAAEADGFSLLWIAICALTVMEYPFLSDFSHGYSTLFLSVVALRNVLLAVATLRALFPAWFVRLRTLSSPAAKRAGG